MVAYDDLFWHGMELSYGRLGEAACFSPLGGGMISHELDHVSLGARARLILNQIPNRISHAWQLVGALMPSKPSLRGMNCPGGQL